MLHKASLACLIKANAAVQTDKGQKRKEKIVFSYTLDRPDELLTECLTHVSYSIRARHLLIRKKECHKSGLFYLWTYYGVALFINLCTHMPKDGFIYKAALTICWKCLIMWRNMCRLISVMHVASCQVEIKLSCKVLHHFHCWWGSQANLHHDVK